jgi:steroid 5-alpha reductase family enzyme
MSLLPTLIVNSKREDTELCTRDYIGWGVWLAGMLMEVIADYQKYAFRSNPANK